MGILKQKFNHKGFKEKNKGHKAWQALIVFFLTCSKE